MADAITNFNFLQPSNFKVVIDRKRFGNLEFYAQRVAHPGVTVNNPPNPFRGIQNVVVPGDTLSVDTLSLDILLDEGMSSYTEIYEWITGLINRRSKRQDIRTSTSDPDLVDITLSIMSSHNNTVKYIRYIDCVPINLGTLLLESTTGDTNVLTFPVTFACTNFELLKAS